MSRGRLAVLLAGLMLLGIGLAAPAFAFKADKPLADPKLEARAVAISSTLRCLVCQNESIEDSDAPLAADLRQIVRQRLAAGDTDAQVRQYLVDRYGDWVLLKPPLKEKTLLLWFGPGLLLLAAAAGTAVYFRRRQAEANRGPAPLSAEEERRLRTLLDDRPGG